MRIVTLVLVGVALIGGAFGLGRITRADADPAPPRAVSTPVPLEAGQPVSAAGPSEAASLPALRPAPKPKKAKKKASPPRTTTSTASPAPTAAPTSAPSTPRPATPAPSNPQPKPKPQTPVEEIG